MCTPIYPYLSAFDFPAMKETTNCRAEHVSVQLESNYKPHGRHVSLFTLTCTSKQTDAQESSQYNSSTTYNHSNEEKHFCVRQRYQRLTRNALLQ